MTYRTGDYVFPTDLPRRFLCRVAESETLVVGRERCQILKLQPLEGPWPPQTTLIRLDPSVMRAVPGDLWNRPRQRPTGEAARTRHVERAA